ncbi:MAG: helix-turn-helix transcriptional regulator [Hoeflea sp.]|uniref:helix-turn-helix domain-containing protein n=1 Tax=Hoeflea sp. TaxID=1940281 RepID=UPI001DF34C42|nr:helix-turn-helix transcriptional regulator [Hoeflea sp.]MBU4528475.1 helix-turn-helix transcriptional regulator [Alphaproteobacteria bacterium]MBU4544818.1 helix-turn-helix transcriptional regulator [Alphaproteobacteria bacterium]MBU4551436.1 helix-turn-helix transcriptional regulator [Alphaproteobacteria bacterium]MBV1721844.1 helix-turn-helix transcriptional regulator [Hoeflea sp.]MBV1762906.1 helix-turn-helix transcriptional regulator [Hoeflea sp.]
MTTQFGDLLKHWREARKVSQLDLGLEANVSARHISFLETGRARPSRAMVLNLGTVLDLPRGSRNAMLHAAGFAPSYRSRDLNEAEMAPIAAALDWMLDRHLPYPAMVLDRHWTIVRANATAKMMLAQIGLDEGANLIEALLDESQLPRVIENWDETARHFVHRLRAQSAHLGGDAWLDQMAARLAAQLGDAAPDPTAGTQAIIATRYRLGEMTLSFFSTLSQFSTAEDIALADWQIEHLFPADEATREVLVGLGGLSG